MTKQELKERLNGAMDQMLNDEAATTQDMMIRLVSGLTTHLSETNLLDYGIQELSEKDRDEFTSCESLEDVVDIAFDRARIDGTLTFSTFAAFYELICAYSPDELNDLIKDYPMFTSWEQLHIIACELELIVDMEELYHHHNNIPIIDFIDLYLAKKGK